MNFKKKTSNKSANTKNNTNTKNLGLIICIILVIVILCKSKINIFKKKNKEKEKFEVSHEDAKILKQPDKYNYEDNPLMKQVLQDFNNEDLNYSNHIDIGVYDKEKDIDYNSSVPLYKLEKKQEPNSADQSSTATTTTLPLPTIKSQVYSLQREIGNQDFKSLILNPMKNMYNTKVIIDNNTVKNYILFQKQLEMNKQHFPDKMLNNESKKYHQLSELVKTDLIKMLYTNLKENLLTSVNNFIKLKETDNPILFEIVQDELLDVHMSNKLNVYPNNFKNNNKLNIIFNLILHRPYKTHSFNLQLSFFIHHDNLSNNKIVFKSSKKYELKVEYIKILGNTFEGNLERKVVSGVHNYEGTNSTKSKSAPFSTTNDFNVVTGISNDIGNKKTVQNKINEFNTLISESEVNSKIQNNNFLQNTTEVLSSIGKDKVKEYVAEPFINMNSSGNVNLSSNVNEQNMNNNMNKNKNKNENKNKNKNDNKNKEIQFDEHKCFGINSQGKSIELTQFTTPVSCQSFHEDLNQKGIWDAPCKKDNDCLLNGVCNTANGICEYVKEPKIEVIGYTHISPFSMRKCPPNVILPNGETGVVDGIIDDDLYCPI